MGKYEENEEYEGFNFFFSCLELNQEGLNNISRGIEKFAILKRLVLSFNW